MKTTTEANLETAPGAKEFGDRWVALAGGRHGLRGLMPMTVRTPSGAEDTGAVLDFVASDDTIDRYDEVIDAKGWDLANYRKNPVFQNSHQYGDIMFTLGKSLMTEVLDGKLYERIEFAVDVNPVAKICFGLYKGGYLNAVSVGFIPKRWEAPPVGQIGEPTFRRRYLEQELLELSAVAIPANPNALALAYRSGAVSKGDLWELYDFLKDFCSKQADLARHAGAPASEVHGARLLPNGEQTREKTLISHALTALRD